MTKTNGVERLAVYLKALSDPTRLRIVKLLNEHQNPLCVNALAHRLGVSQSAVSQHLRVLRQAGLVRGRRHGPFVHYSINPEGVTAYKRSLLDTLGDREFADRIVSDMVVDVSSFSRNPASLFRAREKMARRIEALLLRSKTQ